MLFIGRGGGLFDVFLPFGCPFLLGLPEAPMTWNGGAGSTELDGRDGAHGAGPVPFPASLVGFNRCLDASPLRCFFSFSSPHLTSQVPTHPCTHVPTSPWTPRTHAPCTHLPTHPRTLVPIYPFTHVPLYPPGGGVVSALAVLRLARARCLPRCPRCHGEALAPRRSLRPPQRAQVGPVC
jgi:hypothetical protein